MFEQPHLNVPQLFGITAGERPFRIKVGMRFGFFVIVVSFLFPRRIVFCGVFARAGRGKQFFAYDVRFQGDLYRTAAGLGRKDKQFPGVMQDRRRVPDGLFFRIRFRGVFKGHKVGKGDFQFDFRFLPFHGQIHVRSAVLVGFVRVSGRREQRNAGQNLGEYCAMFHQKFLKSNSSA
jgi:hypothetical protein